MISLQSLPNSQRAPFARSTNGFRSHSRRSCHLLHSPLTPRSHRFARHSQSQPQSKNHQNTRRHRRKLKPNPRTAQIVKRLACSHHKTGWQLWSPPSMPKLPQRPLQPRNLSVSLARPIPQIIVLQQLSIFTHTFAFLPLCDLSALPSASSVLKSFSSLPCETSAHPASLRYPFSCSVFEALGCSLFLLIHAFSAASASPDVNSPAPTPP